MIRRSSSRVGLRLALSGTSDASDVIAACEDKLQANPFDTTVLMRLAEAAQAMSYTDTAIQTFSDIVELCGKVGDEAAMKSTKKDALRSLGLSLYAATRFQEAGRFRRDMQHHVRLAIGFVLGHRGPLPQDLDELLVELVARSGTIPLAVHPVSDGGPHAAKLIGALELLVDDPLWLSPP